MTITYDTDKLEYVAFDTGNIVPNPNENFGINKQKNGVLKLLFNDNKMENEYITSDGSFVNLTFKVLGACSGTSFYRSW